MNEEYYIGLVYKKVENDLSPSEHQELQKWLNDSKDHRDTMQTIEAIWRVSAQKTIPDIGISVEDEFHALEERIDKDHRVEAERKKNFFLGRRSLLLAASMAVLITIGGVWWNQSAESTNLERIEIVTSMEKKSIVLPDGSSVELNKNSKLSYPKSFRKKERSVALLGEAFFSVVNDPKRPFSVDAGSATVSVLGTLFNVKIDSDSGKVSAYVKSGKVRLSPERQNQNVVLEARDLGEWNPNSEALTKISNVTSNHITWYSGKLEFEDERITNVIKTMEQHYNTVILVANDELSNCNMTLVMDQLSLDQALNVLTTVLSAEWESINSNQYRIVGGSCD